MINIKNNMYNIFQFVTLFYDPSNVTPQSLGGVPIQAFRLTKALSRLNTNQDVLTQSKVMVKIANTNIINPPLSNLLLLFLYGIYILSKNKTKYNCIHIHADGGFFPLLFGCFVYFLFKLPTVYTFHCCRNVTYQINRFKFIEKFLMNNLEKWCIQHASHCVFLSNKTVISLINKGIIADTKKVSVISDSIKFDRYNEIYNIKEPSKKEIVYIGRISYEKGWNIIVNCAEKFKSDDFHFSIYGTGPQKKILLKQIKRKQLSNIDYYGEIPNEKVFSVMSDANIILIPSYFEELGSVALEAGLMQKNVVASDIGGLSELLSNNRGYLAKAGCVKDFCNAIKYITNNDVTYGKALFDYVSKNYNIEKSAREYLDIYSKNRK